MTNTINFFIFINTWSNYNENGAEGGCWLHLPMDDDNLQSVLDEISERLGDEDPEFFINDVNTNLDIEVDENDDILELNEMLQELARCDVEHVLAYLESKGGDLRNAIDHYEESIFYPGMDMDDVAHELAEEMLHDVPDTIARYFDFAAYARDLEFGGYTETAYGVICVR